MSLKKGIFAGIVSHAFGIGIAGQDVNDHAVVCDIILVARFPALSWPASVGVAVAIERHEQAFEFRIELHFLVARPGAHYHRIDQGHEHYNYDYDDQELD